MRLQRAESISTSLATIRHHNHTHTHIHIFRPAQRSKVCVHAPRPPPIPNALTLARMRTLRAQHAHHFLPPTFRLISCIVCARYARWLACARCRWCGEKLQTIYGVWWWKMHQRKRTQNGLNQSFSLLYLSSNL